MVFEAYCLKTKQKEVIVNPTLYRTDKGGYMVKGADAAGNKLSLIVGKDKVDAIVAAGIPKSGF